MAAMGSISHVEGLKKVLEFSLTPEFRRQDMFGVLGSTARNPYGLKLAWNFFKENYDILNERYSNFIGHFAKNITQNFYSIEQANEVKEFFDKNLLSANKPIQQGIEKIMLNAQWLERDGEAIQNYLEEYRTIQ